MSTDLELIITDESNLRTWRTEIPNIIDDLGLDPYQHRLYVHYKRVCGAAGGTCKQGIRTIAAMTRMSTAKVSIARRELANLGLVVEHPQPPKPGHKHGQVHVTIVDIWRVNFLYFSFDKRPGIAGWSVAQLEKWTETVYQVNGEGEQKDADRLPGKRPVYQVNGGVGSDRLPGKQKKEPCSSKKELLEEGGASAPLTAGPDRPINGREEEEAGEPAPSGLLTDSETPDPETMTVAEIRALDLDDGGWRALLAAEQAGKNRASVGRHVKAILEKPPPAVLIYRDIAERFPKKTLWESIDQAVGREEAALAFWGDVILRYIGCGWNGTNIVGMIDFYNRRELPGGNGRNGNAQNGRGGGDVLPTITREQGERLRRELRARKQAAGG